MNKNYLISAIFVLFFLMSITILGLYKQNKENVINPVPLPTEPKTTIKEEQKKIATIYGSWEWISTTLNDDSIVTPNAPGQFIITFNEDGSFSTTTDCNSGSGFYILDGSDLTFGPIATTEMYCKGSKERMYYTALNDIQGFIVEGDTLTLLLKYDSGGMNFARTNR